ncbi:MAG: threonine--tRNA ligase [Candidatus Eisenbacteria bacterium]|nr:threonine--tRNA ligase [Candidatus Latescibacterota bacterium]MBD3303242.1 threonine--tRNA ligase [Candidatus Eisenbacteria bacterium]
MQDQEIAREAESLSEEQKRLYRIRHSLAHVLAQAVLEYRPGAKLGFGPPVEHGFYYDFDLPEPIGEEDLPKIQKRMKKILRTREEFVRQEMGAEEAIRRTEEMGQPFKIEAAGDLRDKGVDVISFYTSGPFVDMCEGPHVANTGEIPADAFRLDSVAGAYWRGDEKNKMLTRIYGLAFFTKEELEGFIERRRLAMERDHRKLGRELDIFHIDESVGKGLPLWLPNGTVLRDEIEKLAMEYEFRYGYERVSSPHIAKEELYVLSGHLQHYKESMFPPMDYEDEEGKREVFYMKPMNCPHHHLIFRCRPRSYRDLPLRFAEYGTVYRFEKSGELAGLLRVRGMTMNDAHIYCTYDQAKEESIQVMKLYKELYDLFELEDYTVRFSTHDPANREKFHDNEPLWEASEKLLREALIEAGIVFEEGFGEAAFYGPKVDVQFKNLLGREETVSTVQLDYVAAEKFDLSYTDEHGADARPAVIHRAPLSVHERMLSFLIEHYGGAFPTWLAPIQVRLVTVNDDLLDYANRLKDRLRADFVRAEVDDLPHSFGKKIRNASTHKIPIVLVIGKREMEEGQVTVRRYRRKEQETVSFDAFREALLEEIRGRVHVKPDEDAPA